MYYTVVNEVAFGVWKHSCVSEISIQEVINVSHLRSKLSLLQIEWYSWLPKTICSFTNFWLIVVIRDSCRGSYILSLLIDAVR